MGWLFTSGGQIIGASASASVLPMSNSGLISCRIDWFDLLAVQTTLKNLLQHHSKSISSSMLSLLSGPTLTSFMTTGKTIALTRWTFVGKVMFLLFNMLSILLIAFLPRSKRLLTLWLQSWSAVILEAKKIKSVTISIFSSFLKI